VRFFVKTQPVFNGTRPNSLACHKGLEEAQKEGLGAQRYEDRLESN